MTATVKTVEDTSAVEIRRRFFNGRQSVEFDGLFKIGDDKVRVVIDVDSYDFQSSAVAKVYNADEKQWNFLTKIPYSQMKTIEKNTSAYRKVTDENGTGLMPYEKQAFNRDIYRLLQQAEEILL